MFANIRNQSGRQQQMICNVQQKFLICFNLNKSLLAHGGFL